MLCNQTPSHLIPCHPGVSMPFVVVHSLLRNDAVLTSKKQHERIIVRLLSNRTIVKFIHHSHVSPPEATTQQKKEAFFVAQVTPDLQTPDR